MSEPDFDKNLYTKTHHIDGWAVLVLKNDPSAARLIRRFDGDWEANDSGPTKAMIEKFERVTETTFSLPEENGIGYTSMDKALPHRNWEQIDAFEATGEIWYSLWVQKDQANPRGVSISATLIDGELGWRVIDKGWHDEIRHGWDMAKASLAIKPREPEPDPMTKHANFGRF